MKSLIEQLRADWEPVSDIEKLPISERSYYGGDEAFWLIMVVPVCLFMAVIHLISYTVKGIINRGKVDDQSTR